jgi:hypothetical protein
VFPEVTFSIAMRGIPCPGASRLTTAEVMAIEQCAEELLPSQERANLINAAVANKLLDNSSCALENIERIEEIVRLLALATHLSTSSIELDRLDVLFTTLSRGVLKECERIVEEAAVCPRLSLELGEEHLACISRDTMLKRTDIILVDGLAPSPYMTVLKRRVRCLLQDLEAAIKESGVQSPTRHDSLLRVDHRRIDSNSSLSVEINDALEAVERLALRVEAEQLLCAADVVPPPLSPIYSLSAFPDEASSLEAGTSTTSHEAEDEMRSVENLLSGCEALIKETKDAMHHRDDRIVSDAVT